MLTRRSFLRFISAALALPFVARAERVEADDHSLVGDIKAVTTPSDFPQDAIHLTPATHPGVLHATSYGQPWNRTAWSNAPDTIEFKSDSFRIQPLPESAHYTIEIGEADSDYRIMSRYFSMLFGPGSRSVVNGMHVTTWTGVPAHQLHSMIEIG